MHAKLQQLEQFAFTSTTLPNEKKRQRNFKNEINSPNKRRKLNNNNKESEIQNRKHQSNKKIAIKYDVNQQKESDESVQIQQSPFIVLTTDIINEGNNNSPPPYWTNVYNGILNMRKNGIATNAEVDRLGAASLFDKSADIKTQRFHVMISLLLSSQTKDNVTAQAVYNLQKHFNGLTVDSICAVTNMKEINDCICMVGFHNRKTNYLFKMANVLKNKYGGNVPHTINELLQLPGIGPKMAYIAIQIIWNKNIGIGIDVHCHRILNLLNWTRNKNVKQLNIQGKKFNNGYHKLYGRQLIICL